MLAAAAPAVAADRAKHNRVVAVEGVAKGNADRRVEILVACPGRQERQARRATARSRRRTRSGRRRSRRHRTSNGYSFTGPAAGTAFPVRAELQRRRLAARRAAPAPRSTNSYGDWSSVSGSSYRIQSGGTTSRCPSLVRECPGAQRNDGFNDVGWARLSNGTLGVTWSTSGRPEADMAINTRYAWITGCRNSAGRVRPRRRSTCTRTATSPASATRATSTR